MYEALKRAGHVCMLCLADKHPSPVCAAYEINIITRLLTIIFSLLTPASLAEGLHAVPQ